MSLIDQTCADDQEKISWDAIGNAVWTTLHTFVYSVEDAQRGTLSERLHSFYDLVSCIQRLYPCITCYTNLNGCHRETVSECGSMCYGGNYASAQAASNALALWVFRMHNVVTRWKLRNYTDEPLDPGCSGWIGMEANDVPVHLVLAKLRSRWNPH
mgnify:CR=1 FL=1